MKYTYECQHQSRHESQDRNTLENVKERYQYLFCNLVFGRPIPINKGKYQGETVCCNTSYHRKECIFWQDPRTKVYFDCRIPNTRPFPLHRYEAVKKTCNP